MTQVGVGPLPGAGNDTVRSEPDTLVARARRTTERATGYLLSLQDSDGWWKGDLQTNVTMDAEDLMLRQFLGLLTDEITVPAARWIRSEQRADGTWSNFHDGPADLSTTIEAYVALRLAGDTQDEPHMITARDYIREHGGIENSRVFTRIWLALFGEWSWDELPVMPPEMIFLPSWFPLNIYDWGQWARQTVVPLTIVCAKKPVRSLGFDLAELHVGKRRKKKLPLISFANAFEQLDKVLHGYEKLPVKPLRSLALKQGVEWIVAHQEADGCWGGIQPPWVYSIMALHLMGYALDHPVLEKAIKGLDGFTVWEETPNGTIRWMEACQSPVWDTCLAMTGLLDAGVDPNHPALVKAADWIIAEEIRVASDWAVKRPGVTPGGWAFEFQNDNYPDTDDTAEVVLALRRSGNSDSVAAKAAIERAVDWLIAMQSKDGGWGAFDADNTQTLTTKLPFCDFGAVIDPPSADVTAHVVEMLAEEGMADAEVTQRGVRWLLRSQEDDGSWFGRWGANYVYGCGAVVPALVKVGISKDDPVIRRAVTWLERHQNTDGGWGEDLRSYQDRSWAGKGHSTPSQTAWALMALHAAGERGDAVRRGIDYLGDTQRADGRWDEDYFTGTGFPGDFYLNYHLYRMVFPLSALGRFLDAEAAI